MSFPASSASVCAAELADQNRDQLVNAWIRPVVLLAVAGVITLVLLRSTAVSMVTIWYGSSTYSYGLVVLPISALLVWRRRTELKTLRPTISPIGLAFVLCFAGIWVVANVADVQVVQQFALIGWLEALVWAFLGPRVIRVLLFPLAFLFFAVPAGESLVVPLQRLTAIFTVGMVRLCGIPAVQNGFVFSTPSGDWKIAEACSGVRYLTSSLVIGVLIAGVAFRSWKRRITFVLISAVVPIVANALRAFLIVVLAYLTSIRIASGIDHIIYGWIFFSLVTTILISVALRWREADSPREVVQDTAAPQQITNGNARLFWCTAVAILIVASATAISGALWSRNPTVISDGAWSAPADWLPIADPDYNWTPSFKTVESRTFIRASREVSVFVGFDTRRRRGVELVNSGNAAGISGEWELLSNGYRRATVAGKPVTVAEYLFGAVGQRRLVWMWYVQGGEITGKPSRIKWMQAKSRLAGRPANVLVFAISARVDNDSSLASMDLRDFAQSMTFGTSREP